MKLEDVFLMTRADVSRRFAKHINPSLARLLSTVGFDRSYVRAEGAWLWDEAGNRYLDCLSGYGSLNLGHNHPRVRAAIDAVMGRPVFVQATPNPFAVALGEVLAALTPGDLEVAFFSNSGAEAVEAALKLARAATRRPVFVSTDGSFHGKTLGALSVTGREKYRQPFEPLIPTVRFVPFGDAAALADALALGDVAAFIVEPIQGEGGVVAAPPGYLRDAAMLCRESGTLLIIDEIQTGLGRTGTLFACEHDDVDPDILCLAKSLGGGLVPIGATISRRRIWDQAYKGQNRALLHTSTFGGNSLACAAALATIEVMVEQDLSARAAELGGWFIERLRGALSDHRMVKEVRGVGLMVGIEFYEPAKGAIGRLSMEYFAQMVAVELLDRHHILSAYTLNNPNVIRLAPPLIVEQEDLERVVDALVTIAEEHRGIAGLAASTTKTVMRHALRSDTRTGNVERELFLPRPVGQVWRYIRDAGHLTNMPGITQAVEKRPFTVFVRGEETLPLLGAVRLRYRIRFEEDGEQTRLAFRTIGYPAQLRGEWRLRPHDDGTMMTFSVGVTGWSRRLRKRATANIERQIRDDIEVYLSRVYEALRWPPTA